MHIVKRAHQHNITAPIQNTNNSDAMLKPPQTDKNTHDNNNDVHNASSEVPNIIPFDNDEIMPLQKFNKYSPRPVTHKYNTRHKRQQEPASYPY